MTDAIGSVRNAPMPLDASFESAPMDEPRVAPAAREQRGSITPATTPGPSTSTPATASIASSPLGKSTAVKDPETAATGLADGFKSDAKSGATMTSAAGTRPSTMKTEGDWQSVYSHIWAATPSSFTREMNEYLTDVAVYAQREPSESGSIVRECYGATPSSFYPEDEMVVMASALAGPRYEGEMRPTIRDVWNATPSRFDGYDNSFVMGAALLSNVDDPYGVVRSCYNSTPASFSSSDESGVMAAALVAELTPSEASSIINDVESYTYGWDPTDRASEMMDQLLGDNDVARDSLAWLQEHYS